MSKELIQDLRMFSKYVGPEIAKAINEAADSLEPKAAPVGEREAYEAWKLSMKPYGFDGFDAYQAGAAYQRAKQPQSAEAVAVVRTVPGTDWKCLDFAPGFSLQEQDELTKLYTTPQPSAGVVMPEVKPEIQQKDKRGDYPSQDCYNDGLVDGWNACLDEFARLNGKEVGRG